MSKIAMLVLSFWKPLGLLHARKNKDEVLECRLLRKMIYLRGENNTSFRNQCIERFMNFKLRIMLLK
jgi:hypothetical protein